MATERLRLKYQPSFADEVLGYAVNYLTRNEWRIRPIMELDDALQEAYILFLKLTGRYEFENPQHFMAMWKRALHNEVWYWAHQRSQQCRDDYMDAALSSGNPETFVEGSNVETKMRWQEERPRRIDGKPKLMPKEFGYRDDRVIQLERRMRQATGCVAKLLKAVQNRNRRPRRRRPDGTRLTTNEYLCRFAGISPKVPLRREFEEWLGDC